MLAELIVGRKTGRNPVGAFKALAPRTAWVFVGGLGVFTGLVILSFYSVIAGWTLSYIIKTAAGTFGPDADTAAIFAEGRSLAVGLTIWYPIGSRSPGAYRISGLASETQLDRPALYSLQ